MAEALAKDDSVHSNKKMRTDVCIDAVDSTTDKTCEPNESTVKEALFKNFKDFENVTVLNNIVESKTIMISADVKGKGKKAVVILKKHPFSEDKLEELFSERTDIEHLFQNDVYQNNTALLPKELNACDATIIFPATEDHINKYQRRPSVVINETPELFEEITKAYIKTAINVQWVYNILEHKKEEDRIVFEDPDPELGFILLADLKWSGKQLEDFYLQALVHRRDLTCIRDLKGEHIPLLENILEKGKKAITKKFGIPPHHLRIYLHYLPTYYHLHVHFTSLTYDVPGILVGKAVLLTSVINNLRLRPDYYQAAELPIVLRTNHPLYEEFEKKGIFQD